MADSQFNDAALLATDNTFQGRVGSALWQTCVNVSNEAWSSTHASRKNLSASILGNPAVYKPLFLNVAVVDPTVLGVATASGATSLSSSGVTIATQAALVTDTQISNAVSAAFNAFIGGI